MNSVTQLLMQIDQAYDRKSWHGTNLRGSLRNVTLAQAAWRPSAGRHNIWQLVVHTAYWKYAVRRRLTQDHRGSFPLKGSNWFRRPEEATEPAWRADVALLGDEHRKLRAAIASVPARALHRPLDAARGGRASGGATTTFDLIVGIAAHDLYHAGQIQLLKKLARR